MNGVDAGDQLLELAHWCASPDARSAAAAELRRRRLPDSPDAVDDVLGETIVRVQRRLDRLGPLDPHTGGGVAVQAYARVVVRDVARDLLRGPRLVSLDDDNAPVPLVADPGDDVAERLGGAAVVDETRREILVRTHDNQAWVGAAALTVATLAEHPGAAVEPATPAPTEGKGADRLFWAGLHYAGRADCFSDRAGEADAACRNRRARAVGRVRRLLRSAWEAAHAAEEAFG